MRAGNAAAAMILLGSALLGGSAYAQMAGPMVPDMATLNPDGDGTVDLAEALAAGAKLYAAINTDGDETLEPDETTGRVEGDDWTAANPDGDETLEMDEWNAVIEARLKAADPDNDGSVDEAEFATPEGQKLLQVIQQ